MPTVLAASTINVPGGTVSLWPSMVRLMSGMRCLLPIHGEVSAGGRWRACDPAFVAQRVVLVLAPEVAHRRIDDPPAGVAEATEAPAVLQPVGYPQEDVELDLRALVTQDAL